MKHVLDERATNARIQEQRHDLGGGVTLCGAPAGLMRREPSHQERPTFVEEGRMDPRVERSYQDAWDVGHVFNYARAGWGLVEVCGACLRVVESTLRERGRK